MRGYRRTLVYFQIKSTTHQSPTSARYWPRTERKWIGARIHMAGRRNRVWHSGWFVAADCGHKPIHQTACFLTWNERDILYGSGEWVLNPSPKHFGLIPFYVSGKATDEGNTEAIGSPEPILHFYSRCPPISWVFATSPYDTLPKTTLTFIVFRRQFSFQFHLDQWRQPDKVLLQLALLGCFLRLEMVLRM